MINSKIYIIPESIQLLKISDNEYFGSKYKDYISNSRLALINPDQDGSPELYKEGLGANQILSDAFYLGSAIHSIILQKEDYQIVTNVDKPSGKMFFAIEDIIEHRRNNKSIYESIKLATENVGYFKDKLDSINKKSGKSNVRTIIENSYDYYKHKYINPNTHDSKNRELIFLDSYNRYRAFECIKAIKASDDAMKILNPVGFMETPLTSNEDTFICDILVKLENGQEITLPIKSKIDNWTLDLENDILTLNDLKTTSKTLDTFKESFTKYHYSRQIGMYFWILNEYIKHNYTKSFKKFTNIIVVEKSKPFNCGVFKINANHVSSGFKEFKELITRVAYCELNGYENGYEL